MQGAEILVYPTAIGWHPEEKAQFGERQHGAWETVQRGHAVANGCFVIAVNRTGFEPDPGGSGGIEGKMSNTAPGGDLNQQIDQEIEEFRVLEGGVDPETGEPFEDVERLLRLFLERNVTDDDDALDERRVPPNHCEVHGTETRTRSPEPGAWSITACPRDQRRKIPAW